MGIPSFREFIQPLVHYLAEHPDGVAIADAYEAVADRLHVSAEDREVMLPSGVQAVYKNRIGWAHDRLKRARLSTSPRRGLWKITEVGLEFARAHREPLDQTALRALAYPRTQLTKARDPATAEPEPQEVTEGPEERIQTALAEVNESVGADLLEYIGQSSPQFFERLVLDLLHAMGYGTSRADLQRVGKAGDGGIDGIISLDRLGLEKVYVQAKRWQNNVGRPELQGFFGALAGRRASKGVFITTSAFTRDAREFADSVSDSIVLVDGQRLTDLMIEHGVAVAHKTLRIAKVDSDYFDEL